MSCKEDLKTKDDNNSHVDRTSSLLRKLILNKSSKNFIYINKINSGNKIPRVIHINAEKHNEKIFTQNISMKKSDENSVDQQINKNVKTKQLSGKELKKNIKNQYINIYKLNSDQFAKSKLILDKYCLPSKESPDDVKQLIDKSELSGDELKNAIRNQYINIYRLDDEQFKRSKLKIDRMLQEKPFEYIREIVIKSSIDLDKYQEGGESDNNPEQSAEPLQDTQLAAERLRDIDACSNTSPYSLVMLDQSRHKIGACDVREPCTRRHRNEYSQQQRECSPTECVDKFMPCKTKQTNPLINAQNVPKSKNADIRKQSSSIINPLNFKDENETDEHVLLKQANPVKPMHEDNEDSRMTMLQAIMIKYEECGTNIYVPKTPRKTGLYYYNCII